MDLTPKSAKKIPTNHFYPHFVAFLEILDKILVYVECILFQKTSLQINIEEQVSRSLMMACR